MTGVNNKENNFLSAVCYVHNAAQNIVAMLELLYAQLEANFNQFEIICVDDACTDDSCARIRALAEKMRPNILSLVHMGYFQGVEAAMSSGVSFAIGDFVLEFDSTICDYSPGLILDVYRRALTGYDVVSAVPEGTRRKTSRLFYRLFNRHFSGNGKLRTERFRILSRRLINRINGVFSSIPYRKVAYLSSGLACTAIMYNPIEVAMTEKQKESESYRWNIAADTLILYTDIAYKFSSLMSILMMCLTLLSLMYTVVVFLTGNPVSGWTTTMLLLSIGLFAIFCILTMLIKYMAILVSLQNRRSDYVISSTEKL